MSRQQPFQNMSARRVVAKRCRNICRAGVSNTTFPKQTKPALVDVKRHASVRRYPNNSTSFRQRSRFCKTCASSTRVARARALMTMAPLSSPHQCRHNRSRRVMPHRDCLPTSALQSSLMACRSIAWSPGSSGSVLRFRGTRSLVG
jgi:hypothetical protein